MEPFDYFNQNSFIFFSYNIQNIATTVFTIKIKIAVSIAIIINSL